MSDSKNQLNAVVTHIMQVSPTMKIIRIAPDGWEVPDFKAGQFVTLALPAENERCPEATEEPEPVEAGKLIKRAYSVASSSKSKEYIEFYITLVRSGALTPRIFNLTIGDKIQLGQRCVGMFTLDKVPEDKNIVLVATGTGVAPYVSMLRSDALTSKRKIAVIHGAANSWDLGYSSELTLLQSIADDFAYLPTVIDADKEPTPWKGDTRYVQDMWTGGAVEKAWGIKPTPENTHVFLCGNPKMVEAMVDALESEDFVEHKPKQEGQIHVERW